MQRGSGILLAVSSLPGRYGIGTFGREAYDFIDALAEAGQKYWQILPLTETGVGGSPYQSVSAFAGNINYIDFSLLREDGLLTQEELAGCESSFVNGRLADLDGQSRKEDLLYPAFERGRGRFRPETEAFCRTNRFWIYDYALYKAITKADAWTPALRRREENALREAREALKENVDFYIFTQFLFDKQWSAVRAYAAQKGISVIGDMPIYVSADSADVWANPQWFQKDAVAGCPPDYFSEEGQNWGNPLYDWEALRQNGYGFWIERMAHAFRTCDIVRLDHFRGFEAYWAIPKNAKSAKEGHWEQGPGKPFFDMLKGWFGSLPVIAEDLGTLTPSFFEFMKDCGFPGLCVLQFAFAPFENSLYLPHNAVKNRIIYTGTHDNDTTLGWYRGISEKEKEFIDLYLGKCTEETIADRLTDTAYASVCDVCIIPMQDVLGQGRESRMNEPCVVGGSNWRYRIEKGDFSPELREKIRMKTKIFGR